MNASDSIIIPYAGLLAVSFIIGVVATVANIAIGTLFNQVVPLEMMGRTSAVFNLAVTVFIPVGQMAFGFLYDTILPSVVVIIGGVILIGVTLIYKKVLVGYDEIDGSEVKVVNSGELSEANS